MESSLRSKPFSFKVLRTVFYLFVIYALASNIYASRSITPSQAAGSFSYEFIVNEDGFTQVRVNYRSYEGNGSSWVLVPKFSEWANRTVNGEIINWSLCDSENLTGVQFYFYKALCFSFKSPAAPFEMSVQFNFSTAAMIIEPNGIFYSPQIGFEKGNGLEARVLFPLGFATNAGEAVAIGNLASYRPSSIFSNSNYVLFNSIPDTDNMIRLEIWFKTPNKTPELTTIREGIFTFQAVRRYENYAHEILELYNRTYVGYANLFNVTLPSATVQFFVPDFNSLDVLGYVPFYGEKLGEININIFYTRFVTGYIEYGALHELVHHFLSRAGISPNTFLWFHEGIAQYVGIEAANNLGYEGAAMIKQDYEDGVTQLKQRVGDDLGFLKENQYPQQPEQVGLYYIGAYYVVSRLAEPRGGLEYYARFFKLMNGAKVDDNAMLGYYLSLAANETVAPKLNSWGFGIPDLYTYATLIHEAETTIDEVNPIYQPYKFLAELLYQQALSNAGKNDARTTQGYLVAAILIARMAPLLTLLTFSAILFGAILLVLRKQGVFKSYQDSNP